MEQTWSDYGSKNTAGGYPWTLAFDGSTTGNGTTSGDGTNIVWDITSLSLASGDWVFYLDPGAIDQSMQYLSMNSWRICTRATLSGTNVSWTGALSTLDITTAAQLLAVS